MLREVSMQMFSSLAEREQSKLQAPVVQTMDSAIHRINHYPVDKH